MAIPILFLLIAGTGAALAYSATSKKETLPNKSNVDPNYDWNVWAADLAEIPDAELRSMALLALTTASTPQDIAALTVLADQLDKDGYHKAATRVRLRIQQLHQYYDGS